jgi:uncharacterized protein YciI
MNEPRRSTNHFVYRLLPPRPTFSEDMSASEAAIMQEHARYWTGLATRGSVVVFGPVSDPAGVWGLAVLEAATAEEARDVARADPAVSSGMATFEVLAMPTAVLGSS